ncbi:hypothetical protein HAX54_035122, partial [Datura stramonium]|nr:hypothetical protein [Datura stramonium]
MTHSRRKSNSNEPWNNSWVPIRRLGNRRATPVIQQVVARRDDPLLKLCGIEGRLVVEV